MDEIRMWSLEKDGNSYSALPVEHVSQMEAESQLEELLVKSPDILMPNLRLVGRQNPTSGGFLDLLGIDEDGYLVVFELKRGTLSRDAIAQSIDYASYLDQLSKESLAQHISERSGTGGIEKIEDFESWYQESFPNSPYKFTNHPRIVLVGLGADEKTERMAGYLSQSNLDISLITFHGFVMDGKTVLAKHVKVKAPENVRDETGRYTKTANLQALKELAQKSGSTELLETISSFLREILPGYQWPSKSGYTYSLMEQTDQGTPTYRAYVSIYINEKKRQQVQLVFWKRAVEAAFNSMNQLKQKPGVIVTPSDNLELWIKSISDWEIIKAEIKAVLYEVLEGWKRNQEVKVDDTVIE